MNVNLLFILFVHLLNKYCQDKYKTVLSMITATCLDRIKGYFVNFKYTVYITKIHYSKEWRIENDDEEWKNVK